MKNQLFTRIISIMLVVVIFMTCSFTTVSAAAIDSLSTRFEEYDWVDLELRTIPRMNQRSYEDPYGDYGTISSHGCGIVCVAMIASYMQDRFYDPVRMAEIFGDYNTKNGSLWILFQESAEVMGLPFEKSDSPNGEWYDWNKVVAALKNGQPVVCLQSKGIFTGSGHYIVLTGITEDGKIMVNDPNGYNWTKNEAMTKGYNTGFTEAQIRQSAVCYWIYGEKEVEQESTLDVFTQIMERAKLAGVGTRNQAN